MESGTEIDSSLVFTHGARATEEVLLAALGELRSEARTRPELLAQPVRILVPSASLRMHVCERIARALGSTVGVTVQTLHGVTLEILTAARRLPMGSDALIELLAQRCAREEPALHADLEELSEGYRSVTASIVDLLDAGLESGSAEALLELLDEVALGRKQRERACAILRVAGRVHAELGTRSAGGHAEQLGRARQILEQYGAEALPTRTLFIHGFADVTGRAKDLLQALSTRLSTRFLLDLPRDPEDASRADRGVVFADRLRESVEGVLGAGKESVARSTPVAPELFAAPGEHAEVREIARRIRKLLDASATPERIGIVARNLAAYRTPLRQHLDALGVPFSALRTRAPLDAPGRRIVALAQLFREGFDCPAERWLDATARSPHDTSDLRLALRASGAARLRNVAALGSDSRRNTDADFVLPMGRGVQPGNAAEGTRFRVTRRRLAASEFQAAIATARSIGERIEELSGRACLPRYLEAFRELRVALGWADEEAAEQRVHAALTQEESALGTDEITREEFGRFVDGALNQCAEPPLSATGNEGGGAGVQILDVMEARGRTFEHLFLVGLNRDVFPRPISPDAILPDEVRVRIAEILPDIPIKSRGRSEDRYLFAQLYSAAEHLTLSWLSSDGGGKTRTLSPLVERILGGGTGEILTAQPLHSPEPGSAELELPRSAHELALFAALHGGLDDFEAHLPPLFEDGAGCTDAPALARTRRNILAAFEAQRAAERHGPWLGFLGPQSETGSGFDPRPDPRVEAPFVTRLERLARCPWQFFLQSFLKLEPMKDPWEALPSVEPRILGNVVHNVLQRIDERALGTGDDQLAAVLARTPREVHWPPTEELERILMDEARRELLKTHTTDPGWIRLYAECARPHCDEARMFLEDEALRAPADSGVLGVEVSGEVRVPFGPSATDGEITVVFRADRLERQGTELIWTDYKTGKPTRLDALCKTGIPRAEHLQPITYLLAGLALAEGEAPVRGRYLYLGPDVEEREVPLAASSRAEIHEQLEDLGGALETLVDGWLAGTFFPRLTGSNGKKAHENCEHCEVKEACRWGDSGARAAFVAWGTEKEGSDSAVSPAMHAPMHAPMRALIELATRRRTPPKKAAGKATTSKKKS